MLSRFRSGVNSLGALNRVAEPPADAGGAAAEANAAARQAMRKPPGGFFAKLTGVPSGGSAGQYTFQELYADDSGAMQPLSGGRGTETGDVAVEANGTAGLATGTRVWIQQITDDADTVRYFFQIDAVRLVWVVKDGGSAGNLTTACSYTYTVKDLAGNVLKKKRDGTGDNATGMTPTRLRPTVGYMRCYGTGGGIGIAYYDASGNLVLFDAGEIGDQEACST